MRLLLDSHAFLWWLLDDRRLSGAAREAIADPTSEVAVSAATIWEIEIKARAGRLDAGGVDLVQAVELEAFRELPISGSHALRAARLPPLHADPFDRLLVAQALSEGLTCVTKDAALAAYRTPVLW